MGNKNATAIHGNEIRQKNTSGDCRIKDDLVIVGHIIKPHGLKGEVKVKPTHYNQEPFTLFKKISITLEDGTRKIFTIENIRYQQSFIIMSLLEVKTRDSAEELRGSIIQVKTDELPQLDNSSFYEYQLTGCNVVDKNGTDIGTVESILYTGGTDILVIKDNDGEEIMIPISKQFIQEIKEKIIIIKNIEMD